MLYVFDGGVLQPEQTDSIKLAADELLAAEFHLADALDDLLIPRLARRVKHAITAREQMCPLYLEHGLLPVR